MSTITTDKEMPNNEEEQSKETEECGSAKTPEDELFDLILKYEKEYFEDFRFQRDSIVDPFLKYEEANISEDNNGGAVTVCEDAFVLDIMQSMQHLCYDVRIEDLDDGTGGQVIYADKIIAIAPPCVDDKSVILHEMIHVFETELDWKYKAILLTCLYKDLSGKIPELDDLLRENNQISIGSNISAKGGDYSILFSLKSFDLDLRCGFKLGTVFHYNHYFNR